MYRYKLYGLEFESSRKINLLREQSIFQTELSVFWSANPSDTPDVKLEWQQVLTEDLKKRRGFSVWEAKTYEGVFTKICFDGNYNRNLRFLINPTKSKLWILHRKDESLEDIESILIGPILGCILRLKGITCLHSSVVNIDKKAVAFIGAKKSGKSTTATGLSRFGAKILSDDIAVLTKEKNQIYAQPGYSKVRLRPVAAEFLTENAIKLPMVYSNRDSRYLSLDRETEFEDKPLPLAAIYVLGNISDKYDIPLIEKVVPRENLLRLIENAFGTYMVREKLRGKEFVFLAEVAKRIPVRKLLYSHNIETLPRQAKIIIEDFRKINGDNQK